VLRDHTNHTCGVATTMYIGNKAHDFLNRGLIVKTVRSSLGGTMGTHLHVGKA